MDGNEEDALSVDEDVTAGIGVSSVNDSAFAREVRSYLEEVVTEVMTSKRPYFVQKIANRLGDLQPVGDALEEEGADSGSAAWTEIQSLSRLRSVVGGRFQNLKKRWMEAGFPLREHRGDQKDDYELNEEGWIELSSWIARQGYEARLTRDRTGCLFEVRPRS